VPARPWTSGMSRAFTALQSRHSRIRSLSASTENNGRVGEAEAAAADIELAAGDVLQEPDLVLPWGSGCTSGGPRASDRRRSAPPVGAPVDIAEPRL